jgi:hypothetical protein
MTRFFALLFGLTLVGLACPKPPTPPPVHPDASDAAPAVNPEPGPVPNGDQTKCAVAARHADDVCPGTLGATIRACSRAGGADANLISCIMAAASCSDLSACDKPR